MQGTPRAAWRYLGFVCLIGAVGGCATAAAPPRGAVDTRDRSARTASATRSVDSGIGNDASPTQSSLATSSSSSEQPASSDARSDVDLPWLSPSHVGAAVRAHHSDFQACQALADLESQREDGAVTVGWAVQANGSVRGVTLGSSTFASQGINACVLGVAKKVTFPASAAPTHVSWTVKFRGSPPAPLADATLH